MQKHIRQTKLDEFGFTQ